MSHRRLLIVSALVVFGLVPPGNAREGDKRGRVAQFAQNNRPQLIAQLGHSRGVTSVAFSPDGKRVLTGSDDNTARIWDADTGKELRRLQGHAGSVVAVAFSPDGKQVLTGSWDYMARIWDANTGKELRRLVHTTFLKSVAFAPDGSAH